MTLTPKPLLVFISTVALILITMINSYAQSVSLIKTKDFVIMPVFNQSDSSVVKLNIMVKVHPFINVKEIYLGLGTDSITTTNIISTQATVSHYSGTDSLTYNAINYPLTNYTAYFPLQITLQQWTNAKRASVYVTDINNVATPTLYFTIKP